MVIREARLVGSRMNWNKYPGATICGAAIALVETMAEMAAIDQHEFSVEVRDTENPDHIYPLKVVKESGYKVLGARGGM